MSVMIPIEFDFMLKYYIKLPHVKTKKMTCAPSEDSDQPGRSASLIRVFGVRMKRQALDP